MDYFEMHPPPFLEESRNGCRSAKSEHSRVEFRKRRWYSLCEGLGLARIEADRCVRGCKIKDREEVEYLHDVAADTCVGI
jgi:hypothetical protein